MHPMTGRDRVRAGGGLRAGLGWFGVGIGVAQLVDPDRWNRLIGVDPTPKNRAMMRMVGAQEVAVGGGILAKLRPSWSPWGRVAGDVAHLGMLAAALRDPSNHRRRLLFTMASVLGVSVLDGFASWRLSPRVSPPTEVRVTATTTVRRDPDTVYGYWRDLENLPTFMTHLRSVRNIEAGRSRWVADAPGLENVVWDAEIVQDIPGELLAWRSVPWSDIRNAGVVRFAPAPGDRGTEVTVELEVTPPGGQMGATMAKLLGEHPQQQVRDDLRRFKQVLETGEVLRTEGSPAGLRSQQLVGQRPAQPVGSTPAFGSRRRFADVRSV